MSKILLNVIFVPLTLVVAIFTIFGLYQLKKDLDSPGEDGIGSDGLGGVGTLIAIPVLSSTCIVLIILILILMAVN
jgi:hypothetical protein